MNSFHSMLICLLCVVFSSFDSRTVFSDEPASGFHDTVILKTGGELQGKVESEIKDESDGRLYVILRTASGGLLKLDKARLVDKVRVADELDAEFERRLTTAADDPKLLWSVYEWCNQQVNGASRFKSQMDFVLHRIVETDPTDKRARFKLDYVLIDDKWVLRPQKFAAHGYIKDGTSWAPKLQQMISEGSAGSRQILGEKKSALSQWAKEARKGRLPKSQLEAELFVICDEVGLPIVLNLEAKSENSPALRLMYVEAFGRVPTFRANQALCYFAIEDPDAAVRERALTLLGQPHFDRAASARLMTGYFGTNDNLKIRRAAYAIGELNSMHAVIPLIGALATKHTIAITGNEPGRMQTSFGSGGAGLTTGGGPQSQDVVLQNEPSRIALKKITGQDFGYDEVAWQQWYLQNYTLFDIRVRADD